MAESGGENGEKRMPVNDSACSTGLSGQNTYRVRMCGAIACVAGPLQA